jgi:hypothetical protein
MNLKFSIRGVPALHVACANGISKGTFYHRIRSGWKPEDAATTPPGVKKFPPPSPRILEKKNKAYVLEGEYAVAVARWNGIDEMAFFQRIYRGWSVERAATEPPRKWTHRSS